MRFVDLRLKTKMFSGNAIVLLQVIILGAITYSTTDSLLKGGGMVNHTHVVIEKAMDILGAAVDMETGMRGFLLAGEEEFLAPYTNGYKTFEKDIKALQERVADNPPQVRLLTEIQGNIGEWVTNVTQPTIELRRVIGNAKNMDDMAGLVGEARGKVYFDKFRGQIKTFIKREEVLLAAREKNAASATAYGIENNSTKWVKHTQGVIKAAMEIEAAAVNMETGMRGYLLAGKEEFLGPYAKGGQKFNKKVKDLLVTVSDNSSQVKLLGEIQENINAWQKDVTEPAIALRRTIGHAKTMNDMADLVGEARGKVYFDKFRSQIGTFIGRESALMETRRQVASSTASRAKRMIIAGTITIVVISLVITIVVANAVTRPINKAVALADALAKGDMTQRLTATSKDEVGILSAALNKIAEDLGSMLRKVQNSTTVLKDSSSNLFKVSSELLQSSDENSNCADSAALTSEDVSENMNSISAAMEQSSVNVGMIATATEEMSATVNEISQNTQKSLSTSQDAVRQTKKTSTKLSILGAAAEKIGKVTETINEISEQTNLLALNATIEAARAGEAGKGFAVVANEIKDLAKQTAGATVDIKNQIAEMQATTDDTIKDIRIISGIIETINDDISTIATSVAEQSDATSEISENVAQASAGLGEVNENVSLSSVSVHEVNTGINEIKKGSRKINSNSQKVSRSADDLSLLADELTNMVGNFKVA